MKNQMHFASKSLTPNNFLPASNLHQPTVSSATLKSGGWQFIFFYIYNNFWLFINKCEEKNI